MSLQHVTCVRCGVDGSYQVLNIWNSANKFIIRQVNAGSMLLKCTETRSISLCCMMKVVHAIIGFAGLQQFHN
jgi:hypothetical protein